MSDSINKNAAEPAKVPINGMRIDADLTKHELNECIALLAAFEPRATRPEGRLFVNLPSSVDG